MDIDLLVKLGIVILFLLVGLVQWIQHRRALARGEKVEGPPPEEPKLPYEDVVDEVFGPYMRRRRQKHEEARAREEGAPVQVVGEPRPRPPMAVPKPPPAPPPGPAAEPAPHSVSPAEAPPLPARLSLEDRLFRNPSLGAGAKLVVAAEILGRPKALRRPRPV